MARGVELHVPVSAQREADGVLERRLVRRQGGGHCGSEIWSGENDVIEVFNTHVSLFSPVFMLSHSLPIRLIMNDIHVNV